MRALTLWQPWASAIFDANDPKDVENRPKPPPRTVLSALEPIAIHAGLRYDQDAARRLPLGARSPGPDMCPRGAVLGVVTMTGYLDARSGPAGFPLAVPARPDATIRRRLEGLQDARWWLGPVGIMLAGARRILPVECRGAQGYWTLPKEVERKVLSRLRPEVPESPTPHTLPLDERWLDAADDAERASRLEAVHAFVAELVAGHVTVDVRLCSQGSFGAVQSREVVSLSRSLRHLWVLPSRRRRAPCSAEFGYAQALWEDGGPAVLLDQASHHFDFEHDVVAVPGTSVLLQRCST